MSKIKKLIEKLLSGKSDNNFDFDDLRMIILYFGFGEEIKSSHHIYRIKGHNAFLNIQPLAGNKSKPYQVKQVRKTITRYFIK
ncbi:MAG: type II toxin-antitoxin system HicA family toxin [Ignavibacteria bacterium]